MYKKLPKVASKQDEQQINKINKKRFSTQKISCKRNVYWAENPTI